MLIRFALLVLLILTHLPCFTQADLVLTTAGLALENLNRGEIQLVVAEVMNTGTLTSEPCVTNLLLTNDPTDDAATLELTSVSVQALAPGTSQTLEFLFTIPTNILPGPYTPYIVVDRFDEVPESDEINTYCIAGNGACAQFSVNPITSALRRIAQPLVFIHGLNSDSDTWNSLITRLQRQYGWTNGGRLDFCLNSDNLSGTANDPVLPISDADNLTEGDFYSINFNAELFNSTPCTLSNQEAITKQGRAVSQAIEQILSVNNAEQVVLVGHSMGGLAAREYLQNPINWQPDGDPHVAKLLTIATPNGGSAVSVPTLQDVFLGINSQAVAIRDLRYYIPLIYDGEYLFGGTEDNISIYYNDDINCNGFVGDEIVGLNEKFMPLDITYACIFDEDDEVVDEDRADLNQYPFPTPPFLGIYADKFEVETSVNLSLNDHLNIHQTVGNFPSIVAGLDESSFLENAQPIPFPTYGFSLFTIPSTNHPNQGVDFDDHRIRIEHAGELTVELFSLPVSTAAIFLFDDDLNELTGVVSDGNDNIALTYTLTPGDYILDFGGIPTSSSYLFPYYYYVDFVPLAPLAAAFSADQTSGCLPLNITFTNTSEGEPFTFEWQFEGAVTSSSSVPEPTVTFSEVGSHDITLIVSSPYDSDTLVLEDYITIFDTPEPFFTTDVTASPSVIFTNLTAANGSPVTYHWDFGDGETATGAEPTHIYSGHGAYTVVLSATNVCGTVTYEEVIEIDPVVLTPAFAADVVTGCVPLTVTFTDQSEGSPDLSYAWTFEGGTPPVSTLATPSITYAAAGLYDVTLAISGSGSDAQIVAIDYISVDTSAIAAFEASTTDGTTFEFINQTIQSMSPADYQWDFGDGATSILSDPTHTYQNTGIYTVILSAMTPCGTTTATQTVTVEVTATQPRSTAFTPTVRPNPVGDILSLHFESALTTSLSYRLVDAAGRLQRTGRLNAGTPTTVSIPVTELPAGSYQLLLSSSQWNRRLLVVKL